MLARRQRKPVCSLGGKARNSHLNFFVDLLPSPTPVTCKFKGQRHGFGPLGKRQEGKVRGRRGSGEGRGGAGAPGRWLLGRCPKGGRACGPQPASPLPTSNAGTGQVQKPPRGYKSLILPAQRDRTCSQRGRSWERVGARVRPEAPSPCPAPPSAAVRCAREDAAGTRGGSARRRRRALPGCSVKALRPKK